MSSPHGVLASFKHNTLTIPFGQVPINIICRNLRWTVCCVKERDISLAVNPYRLYQIVWSTRSATQTTAETRATKRHRAMSHCALQARSRKDGLETSQCTPKDKQSNDSNINIDEYFLHDSEQGRSICWHMYHLSHSFERQLSQL